MKLAIVTGANRGIGFETARQLGKAHFHVLLCSRDAARGKEAHEKLAKEGLEVTFHPLDVTSSKSTQDLANTADRLGGAYILVNNAGVFPGTLTAGSSPSALETSLESLRVAMETNTFGAFRLCQLLFPQMKERKEGRIVNVSSGMGQLSDAYAGHAAYRLSKTALNGVTRLFAEEAKGVDILVNSVCPGWVRTDMGGQNAPRSPSQGADTIVWAATLPPGGPTGGFFRDRKAIDW